MDSIHIPLCMQKKISSLGVFYKESQPVELLKPYIRYFWMLRFNDIEYPVKTTPPDGGTDLLIDMNNPSSPRLYGQSAAYFRVPTGYRHNIFGIRLKPGAAHLLLKVPAIELYNTAVPLSDILTVDLFNNYLHKLEFAGITAGCEFKVMLNFVTDWLNTLFYSSNTISKKDCEYVQWIDTLNACSSVDTIMETAALSSRQTERLFKTIYGLSPKTYLRICRFQAVLAEKNKLSNNSWSDISQLFGYYDQSHLCRDFKQLAGMSPEKYYTHYLE